MPLLERDAAGEAFFVAVKVPERWLGVLPAVVAGARVEVDEPETLDLETERDDRARPLLNDLVARFLGFDAALAEPAVELRGLLGQLANLRQQSTGLPERENPALGRAVLEDFLGHAMPPVLRAIATPSRRGTITLVKSRRAKSALLKARIPSVAA